MTTQQLATNNDTLAAGELDDAEPTETFQMLAALEGQGVSKIEIKKLNEAGIHTVDRLLLTSKRKLVQIKGLSEAKVEKAVEGALKMSGRLLFQTAGELSKKRRATILRIGTGSQELDNALGGGVETSAITEFHGEYRTGKTQLVLSLAVSCLQPIESGGANARVLVIDTENSFRPERIPKIAERFGVDVELALDNIKVLNLCNHDHFEAAFAAAAQMIVDEDYRLLIVDSIIMPFRFDYSGRGELSERQQMLGKTLFELRKLVEEFNIAAVLTNQMCADPGSMLSNDAKKAVGGHVLAHIVNTRVYLRKGRGEQRIAKIVDSPSMPEAEATFEIFSGGIKDAD